MYLIALFCDEPCGFTMRCIWNKDYNIQVFLSYTPGILTAFYETMYADTFSKLYDNVFAVNLKSTCCFS